MSSLGAYSRGCGEGVFRLITLDLEILVGR